MDIVLASTSGARQTLLRNAGIAFAAIPPLVDEAAIKRDAAGLTAESLSLRLACAKALAVSTQHPEATVIGADQVLALDDRLYDKPNSRDDAVRQLRQLRGKTHRLLSAVACAVAGEIVWSTVDEARLTMRNFSDAFLSRYLEDIGADALTSVGAYKLESRGVHLFAQVTGDHFTILGLPMLPLLEALRSGGAIPS